MKKKRTRKQKEKTAAKRKQLTLVTKKIAFQAVDLDTGNNNSDADISKVFALDKKLISQDLIKTVWVTIVVLLLLLLFGLIQKGIINFNNF